MTVEEYDLADDPCRYKSHRQWQRRLPLGTHGRPSTPATRACKAFTRSAPTARPLIVSSLEFRHRTPSAWSETSPARAQRGPIAEAQPSFCHARAALVSILRSDDLWVLALFGAPEYARLRVGQPVLGSGSRGRTTSRGYPSQGQRRNRMIILLLWNGLWVGPRGVKTWKGRLRCEGPAALPAGPRKFGAEHRVRTGDLSRGKTKVKSKRRFVGSRDRNPASLHIL